MKKNLLLLLILVLALVSCGGQKKQEVVAEEVVTEVEAFDDGHYAENSLDYWGVYKGVLPAADCPGIETTLTINEDNTFSLLSVYIDRDTSFDEKGTYTLEKGYMTLTFDGDEEVQYYFIGEDTATRLTSDKEFVESELAEHYVLNKVD